ncbi:hypothetical protein FEM48_Zijuj04G0098200 [Ziziphus jujuba var. spinosa]|uniref:Uncharacterized protein n=1 Tax=Ziziphus jujuba var. spinosa TaxID=714518 RepID=A0A978VJ65_ZIZJJ|nr:hypothetical protein FEM48_Zijuj04G0098200 [Ziziphus jujuba var. spinosa]
MVRSAALLCPVAYLGQIPSPLPRIIVELFIAEGALSSFNPHRQDVLKLLDFACNKLGIDSCLTLKLDILTSLLIFPCSKLNSYSLYAPHLDFYCFMGSRFDLLVSVDRPELLRQYFDGKSFKQV